MRPYHNIQTNLSVFANFKTPLRIDYCAFANPYIFTKSKIFRSKNLSSLSYPTAFRKTKQTRSFGICKQICEMIKKDLISQTGICFIVEKGITKVMPILIQLFTS